MCLKDIIHFRRWNTQNTAGALAAGVFSQLSPADPRRLSITITSYNAAGFAAGERTAIHFGSTDVAAGNVQVLTKEQPSVTLRLQDYGSSLLGPIFGTTNAAGNDIVSVVYLYTNEDDYSLTHNP